MSGVNCEIPIIDIEPWLDGSNPKDVVKAVRAACMTYGFFQLAGHGVPLALQHEIFECAKKFFSLPLEHKMALAKDPVSGRGYEVIGSQTLQIGQAPDQKEVMHSRRTIQVGALMTDAKSRLCALEEMCLQMTQTTVPTFMAQISGQICQLRSSRNQLWTIESICFDWRQRS